MSYSGFPSNADSQDVASQGWSLPAPDEGLKDIIRRHRAGARLTAGELARIQKRQAAEAQTIANGNAVDGSIMPRKLTPFELGQRDALAAREGARDLDQYAAGRGLFKRAAGAGGIRLNAQEAQARADAIARPGSGGTIEFQGRKIAVAPTPGRAPKPGVDASAVAANQSAGAAGDTGTSGGTITYKGVVKKIDGRPARPAAAGGSAAPVAPAAPAPKDTVPITEDDEEDTTQKTVAGMKPRRDVLMA